LANQIFSLKAFFYGLPVGFAFSFGLGPVFFSLIKISLAHGFRAATYLAIGVVFSDMVLLGFAYGGVETLLPNNMNVAFWAQIIGGLMLMGIGIVTMIKKTKNTEGVYVKPSTLIFKNITRGFFLNLLNPTNFFEWVGTAGILKSTFHFAVFENISFFIGALIAVFLTELLVAYFASRLRKVLNERVMTLINWVTGTIFLGFGVWLLSTAVH
jgi:threonine/homoserine/homoserine lactone efflux protein